MSLDNPYKLKPYIYQTISDSESLAEKDAKQEIEALIESNNIEEMKIVIERYSQTDNAYKTIENDFKLEIQNPLNFLIDEDRLNYVADNITVFFNNEFLFVDNQEEATRLSDKMYNIQQLVYRTKKLKIKSEAFQKYLKTKTKPQESSVEEKYPKFDNKRQKALYLWYIGKIINASNQDEIARNFGYTAKYAGKGFTSFYNDFENITELTGSETMGLKSINKRIKDLKAVIEELSGEHKNHAEEHLKIMRKNLRIIKG